VANHLAGICAELGVPAKILDLAGIPSPSFNADCYDEISLKAKPLTDEIMRAMGHHAGIQRR